MQRERIIELAKQAEIHENWNAADWFAVSPQQFERFAALIEAECEKTERLGAQNTALLVAIEMKNRDMVWLRTSLDTDDWAGEVRMIDFIDDCIAISPSAELLEARDRKRDAKLLRVVKTYIDVRAKEQVEAWANERESGEWKPELGD